MNRLDLFFFDFYSKRFNVHVRDLYSQILVLYPWSFFKYSVIGQGYEYIADLFYANEYF